jgi:hypothetical protein
MIFELFAVLSFIVWVLATISSTRMARLLRGGTNVWAFLSLGCALYALREAGYFIPGSVQMVFFSKGVGILSAVVFLMASYVFLADISPRGRGSKISPLAVSEILLIVLALGAFIVFNLNDLVVVHLLSWIHNVDLIVWGISFVFLVLVMLQWWRILVRNFSSEIFFFLAAASCLIWISTGINNQILGTELFLGVFKMTEISRALFGIFMALGLYSLEMVVAASPTMRRLLSYPETETRVFTKEKYYLDSGRFYLLETSDPSHSFDVFQDLITHGIYGVCITRLHPEEIEKKYKFKKTLIFWLSKQKQLDFVIDPTNLEGIVQNIGMFTKVIRDSVVLLEGIEYLIVNNTFDKVIGMLGEIKETIILNKSRVIIPINPKIFDEKDLELLKRECGELIQI